MSDTQIKEIKTKNTMSDLNDHLFAQLERLVEEDLIEDPDKFSKEVQRSDAVNNTAEKIINNAALVLKAKIAIDSSLAGGKVPRLLSAYCE